MLYSFFMNARSLGIVILIFLVCFSFLSSFWRINSISIRMLKSESTNSLTSIKYAGSHWIGAIKKYQTSRIMEGHCSILIVKSVLFFLLFIPYHFSIVLLKWFFELKKWLSSRLTSKTVNERKTHVSWSLSEFKRFQKILLRNMEVKLFFNLSCLIHIRHTCTRTVFYLLAKYVLEALQSPSKCSPFHSLCAFLLRYFLSSLMHNKSEMEKKFWFWLIFSHLEAEPLVS